MGYAKTAATLLALLSLAAAPASQPAGDDAPAARRRLAEVVAQNATLTARIKVLEAEITELRRQIAASSPKPAAVAAGDVRPASTYTERAEQLPRDEPEIRSKAIAAAKKLDDSIRAIDAPPAIRAAMLEGRIVPGMTREQVLLICPERQWVNRTNSLSSIEFSASVIPSGDLVRVPCRTYRIRMTDDLVTVVSDR